MTDIEKNALNFVDMLVPGKFDLARTWITADCTYQYKNTVLSGDEIIKSFEDNHRAAVEKLDVIEYLAGTVEDKQGPRVTIRVQDKITSSGESYVHTDRLIITGNGKVGPGSIIAIEHSPIDGQKDQFLAFLKSIGKE